ncbi:MAG TPA: ATP-dependent DNA helicase [Kineosporiaceae bacterium]|nr:ATP-dependent DNA helicase [Kineosporiaceae bacterium]
MTAAQQNRNPAGVAIKLVRPRPEPFPALSPDPAQAALIGRRRGSGPVIVFGAPGSGKTVALIETVAARIERDGLSPGSVLALAPTRVAAARLRDRLSARIGGTIQEPMARTPHSYAFGVLRRVRVIDEDPPPRLISGPEQDRVLAELLEGHAEGFGSVPEWPASTNEQIRELRGFRDELRELLMRAVERGLTPADLARLSRSQNRPEWFAAAQVMAEYLDVTALSTPGAYDPAGIVDAATEVLLGDPELLADERRQRALIVVDDAHELTVAAERLLLALADGGRDIVLAGDPDAATQTFRGARPRALAEAADRFTTAAGRPAPVLILRTVYRHGPLLRSVAAGVASRIGISGAVGHRAAVAFAAEQSAADVVSTDDPGNGSSAATTSPATAAETVATAEPAEPAETVAVRVLGSPAREAAYVAQYLRRHHLEGSVPWRRMVVVVRSTKATSAIRRALGAAGVPVAVPPSEVPVRDELAVVPLRLALRCCLRPAELTAEVAVELLTGSIGGADAIDLRRLRQALRVEELAGGGGRASDALIVEALAGPERLASLDSRTSQSARRVAVVLAAGREAAAQPSATPEAVLWALWSTTGLGHSWRRTALAGGVSGARADRDLDAVMALFEAAARFTDRFPGADATSFLDYLEGQDVPADTLAERAPTDDAVALLTAQGAAGLEWDVVAVCGVQEGMWPDLRLRGSLLGGQQMAEVLDGRGSTGAEGYLAQRRAVLDDELRYFHVAVSRARHHLLVTAVRSDDLMPSTFLDLVDLFDGSADARADGDADPGADRADDELRPLAEVPRTMTLPALVAELRAATVDPAASPERRAAAARQLARLAAAGVPGANPEEWYGLAPISVSGPLREPSALVRVSPSQVESYDRCALRWLLEQSGGRPPSSAAQGLGVLIHELAEQEPDGDETRLAKLLEERFDRLGLGSGWVADAERARARKMVARLAQYAAAARAAGRRLVATEESVRVQVGRAEIRGTVDRLEQDAEGRVIVVDLKTGKSAPAKAEVQRHAQLGVYQVAVEEGGFAAVTGGRTESGGAVLAQLGKNDTTRLSIQQQPALSADEDPQWARSLLASAADGMAGEDFQAKTNGMCRMCALRRSCPLQTEGRSV